MSLQVNLSFKQMYEELCEDCKVKVKALVKSQIQEDVIKELFEGGDDK